MIKHRKRTWLLVIGLLLAAAFLLGVGLAQMLSVEQSRRQQPLSVVDDPDAGTELQEKMQKVHADTELHATPEGQCEVRVENYAESDSCVRVRLVRIATGEVLYQSDVIDPGYNVETVQLSMTLRTGWYSCRLIWEFYDPKTLTLQGRSAQSAVLIVQ